MFLHELNSSGMENKTLYLRINFLNKVKRILYYCKSSCVYAWKSLLLSLIIIFFLMNMASEIVKGRKDQLWYYL